MIKIYNNFKNFFKKNYLNKHLKNIFSLKNAISDNQINDFEIIWKYFQENNLESEDMFNVISLLKDKLTQNKIKQEMDYINKEFIKSELSEFIRNN